MFHLSSFEEVAGVNGAISDKVIPTPNGKNSILFKDFLEWFRGFTDAEACFSVASNNVNNFRFQFLISLHVDDLPLLEFI